MSHMIDLLRNAGAFVVVLGILVFVHEMGHYLAARWRGVHVDAFSIGFGPVIASWTDRVGTVWRLSWLPLGGYVKLHGQERPEDVPPEVRAAWQAGRTFHEKGVGSRAIVVAAGPIANFLLAIVLFAGLFAVVGRPVVLPVVGEVVEGGAAATAGLKAADRVVSIDGRPTGRFEDIQRIVSASPGRTVSLVVQRDGTDRTVPVTLGARTASDGTQTGLLGVRGGVTEYEHIGTVAAIGAGVQQTWDVLVMTVSGIWQLITGGRGADELAGPLGIARMSGQVAQLGLAATVSFIAVLSVNLGLINLFPIPVLDGGHLLFYLAEAIRGRALPARVLEYGFRAGLAVLACLFVFATWNDLRGSMLFRWVSSLLG